MKKALYCFAALLLLGGCSYRNDEYKVAKAACNSRTEYHVIVYGCQELIKMLPEESQRQKRGQAYLRLCWALGKLERWQDALNACSNANQWEVTYPYYSLLAAAQYWNGAYEAALLSLKRAEELLDPKEPPQGHIELYYYYTLVYQKLGMQQEARKNSLIANQSCGMYLK